ncbi:hypothetical protein M1583_01710, partial [Candidatus Marsarchaeota archaeon]|nr:hypothetical protein [Candidatus Marsarchaeota archaeon]
GCISGDIFLDDTCDCRPLLENAMKTIAKKGNGMVIMSLGQDGRGFGTEFKLNTLTLIKEAGIGTVEAFRELSGKKSVDKRSYDGFIAILKFFNVGKNITLMTNNPEKAKILESAGFNTRVLEDGHPKGNKILERNVKSKLKYGVVSS